jgi:RimJ/RimL family protein N-acetyltransferase
MTLAERDIVAVGKRVTIRPFTRDDVDAWQAWPDYDELLIVGTSPRRLNQRQRSEWFAELTERQRQIPFSIDDEHGTVIGRLFLRQVRREEGSAVLGIDLHPDKLGQRYGTEALGAFLPYFFTKMGFRRMLLSVAAHNTRARRSYESLGFHVIGSHWDAHPGPDVIDRPELRHLAHVFRRGAGGLESLYYDMSLERTSWAAGARS